MPSRSLPDSHSRAVEEVAAAYAVDPGRGLASDEAARRRADAGPNEIEPRARPSVGAMVVDAAMEPFVLLLLAAGLGAVLLGEVRDGLLVLVGLIPIVGADVVTEYRGERALEALRSASAPRARVRRDGVATDIAAADLAPGDVVLIRAGDVVPADLRIVRTERLLVDRSVLTGESVPETPSVEADAAGVPLADRRSMAFAGTSVVGGRGEGIVVAVGAATEVGRIAGGLADRGRRRSPLQLELERLVRILLVVALALIATVTTLGFARGQPLGANLLAGISAAIAAIPEEPPILLAVVLGLGAYRLLRRGVLVRRLNAEEVLGAVDLIITDKTGTLTQNRLEVASVVDLDGELTEPTRRTAILGEALRAEEDAWARADGAPPGAFTLALERAVSAAGGDPVLRLGELISAEPVSEVRPLSTTTARRGAILETLVIGAPEAVLALAGGSGAIDRSAWHAAIDAGARVGGRLLGLARRDGDGPWAMRALVAFADPLRDGIGDALAEARGAGIQAIVVTGDHPETAAAVARAAGLGGERIVGGAELDGWDDERLGAELADLHVVSRSTPEQKRRLVRLARERGRVVAVTGDGVNDAPALHGADVAVAMGSGTAVAKEAADLVLGDDSFMTLMYGLREGRRIVDNVQKGLVFLVSTHVAFLGFILVATLAGHGQPLLPLQILWMELFIDVSTSVAFEREPAEPDLMRRRPRSPGAPLLPAGLLARIGLAGTVSALAALWLMETHGGSPEHARWLAYSALVCGQVVRAYANRSLRTPLRRLAPNGALAAMGVAVVATQAAIPFIPGVAEAFHATPLDAIDWLLVAVVALAPAIVAETVRTLRRVSWVA